MARTIEADPTTEKQTDREQSTSQASQGSTGQGSTGAGGASSTPTTGGVTGTSATSGAGSGSPVGGGTQGGPGGTHATQAGTEGRGLSRRGGDLFDPLWSQSPFGLVRRMMDDMDRLFEGFPSLGLGRRSGYGGGLSQGQGGGGLSRGGLGQGLWAPQIEVSERGGNLVVCADLPGLRKEDLHVEVREGSLILEGERRSEQQDEQRGWSERSYGRFYRTIPLPEGVNPEQANATFRDGVLEITLPLPRQEQERGRKIDIR